MPRIAIFLSLVLLALGCTAPPKPQASKSPVNEPTVVDSRPVKFPKLAEKPIQLTASWEQIQGGDLRQLPAADMAHLEGLRAKTLEQSYPGTDFAGFLPPREVQVGDVWSIEKGVAGPLLRQLNDNVTEDIDRDGVGSYALLRARSETHLELIARIHAQFKTSKSMIVTPAQFDARIVVNRDNGEVEYASFLVPTTHQKNINFEMTDRNFLAGMVFSPRLGLEGGQLKEWAWGEEQSLDVARHSLAERFFALEQLQWVPPRDMIAEATTSSKPIFAVIIRGVLNDQSC